MRWNHYRYFTGWLDVDLWKIVKWTFAKCLYKYALNGQTVEMKTVKDSFYSFYHILLQADTTSMADMMERLKKVDSGLSSDSSDETQIQHPANTLDQPIGVAGKPVETPVDKPDQETDLSSAEEDLDLIENCEKSKVKNLSKKSLLRHSSLGILPSSIGIGSGILIADAYQDRTKIRRDSTRSVKCNSAARPGNLKAFVANPWPTRSDPCSAPALIKEVLTGHYSKRWTKLLKS